MTQITRVLLFAVLLFGLDARAARFDQVSDRFALSLASSHPIDLPWSFGAWNIFVSGGIDMFPNRSDVWLGYPVRSIEAVSSLSVANALGERVFLRSHFGASGKPESYVYGLQVGVHILRCAFDSASLQFALGPSQGFWDRSSYFAIHGSGAWSMELFRVKTEARDGFVMRGGVHLGLDIGFLVYDSHINGDFGFMPLRISGGLFMSHGWRRYMLSLEGTQDGRFRILFSFGGFKSVAPTSYPDQ